MTNTEYTNSLAATHIRLSIDALLNALSSACMYRAGGHPEHMKITLSNLERAILSIREAKYDAEKHME